MTRVHIIRQGECLASIAEKYGFRKWQTIYEADENADFRESRPNPNVVFPGDELVIPEPGVRDEDCATEKRHRFRAPRPKWIFRIEMKDEHLDPLAGAAFKVLIGDEVIADGVTDDTGLIECAIPAKATEGTLICQGESIPLRFGRLDPVTRVTGVQQRLNNLGLGAGPVDGIVGKLTAAAVMRFQEKHPDLDVTGVIDDDTRKALLMIHDDDDRVGAAEEDMSQRNMPEEDGAAADPGPCGFDDASLFAPGAAENNEFEDEGY